jgi:hypothetical protein
MRKALNLIFTAGMAWMLVAFISPTANLAPGYYQEAQVGSPMQCKKGCFWSGRQQSCVCRKK